MRALVLSVSFGYAFLTLSAFALKSSPDPVLRPGCPPPVAPFQSSLNPLAPGSDSFTGWAR